MTTSRCDALTKELCLELQDDWADLARSASEANIFQSPNFIQQSLRLFADQAPKAVTVWQGAMLIGLVILRRDAGYAKLPIPFWRSALHHEQFLATPLVRKGCEADFAKGLCQWLDSAPRDCWFLNLSMITADGAIAAALADHCKIDTRAMLTANRFERAAIVPENHGNGSADDLLRPSRRKSIRGAMKRLQKHGDVTIERLSDASELGAWVDDFLTMEDTGWKHENRSSILSCDKETALYRAMIGDAFAADNLHFARLCLDGKPIAYTLDISAPSVSYCLKSAIDQQYRKFSPGVLMEHETLRYYLGEQGLAFVDSCSAPDNVMLNELWPDRKAIMDVAIARQGAIYTAAFRAITAIKSLLKTAPGA
ncbi:MAG: GNAT family N-acetyltransferase [Erythrobacter sp.]